MNHEIMLYGIAQKEQLGFDKAVEECKYRMSRYGVTPNMLVMPPQMLLYMALAPEQKLTYKVCALPAAYRTRAPTLTPQPQPTTRRAAPRPRRASRRASPDLRPARSAAAASWCVHRDPSPTHTTRSRRVPDRALACAQTSEPFEVADDNESLQLLTRNSQIGEFYVMAPPQVKPKGTDGMHTCDIMIFDEERDLHVRVGWRDALNATLCAEGSAFLTKYGAKPINNGTSNANLSQWATKAEAWAKYNDGGAWSDTLDKDVRIIVARPFIEHTMHNVIMAVAGRDTGATLFGPADMQLSANTQVKTIEGHYTGHFKAVVTKPQSIRQRASNHQPTNPPHTPCTQHAHPRTFAFQTCS